MAPATPAGKFTVIPPLVVLTKYPLPLSAVNVEVLIEDVCQSTVPDLPKPVCDAPHAIVIVSPEAPKVIVVPDWLIIFPASGTGAWEAALVNTLNDGYWDAINRTYTWAKIFNNPNDLPKGLNFNTNSSLPQGKSS